MARSSRSGKAVPRPPRRSGWLWLAPLVVLGAAGGFLLLHQGSTQDESLTSGLVPGAHIYSETNDPRQEIAAGFERAKVEHKRVLLDFGGDWCGDCQVLDYYLHQEPNRNLLAGNYVLVHVFIGGAIDQNLDIPARYHVPVSKGVPALAVLDADGKVLYSQTPGEFGHMRAMDPQSVTDFLNRWKA